MKKPIREIINNSLIKKSFKVLIIRCLGVIFLFATTLLITNSFDANLVGQYDISRSVLIIVGTLGLLGFNQSIIYYSGYLVARNDIASIKNIYSKMVFLVLLVSLGLFVIFLIIPKGFINEIFDKEIYSVLFKTMGVVFFFGLTMLNIDLYRAINRIQVSEIFRNVFRHIFFLLALVVLVNLNQQTFLVELFLLNFVFLGIVSTIFVQASLNKIAHGNIIQKLSYKEIIQKSYPMSISVISYLIMQNTDILLLGKFMEFKDVAYYAVAVKLTTIIALVLASVNAVYAPKYSELYNRDDIALLAKNVRNATRFIFILTIPVILTLLFFSESILNLFGPDYVNAKMALYVLLIAQIINTLSGSVGVYMNMSGNERIFQRILVVSLILNILLNIVLIPKYGLVGAASATAISMILWNVYSVFYLYRVKKIKTFLH